MSGPWDKYATPEKKPWEKHGETKPAARNAPRGRYAIPLDPNSIGGQMQNAGTRMLVKGATALPLMAMDLGVATRNVGEQAYRGLAGKPQQPEYELPSAMFNRFLDERTTAPRTTAGQVAEVLGSGAVGAMLPNPAPLNNLPRTSPRPTPKQVTLEAGRREGLVAPPASANPSTINRMLETIGGKTGTAQDAATRNTKVFTDMARRYLGLADDTPITPELLSQMRTTAAQAYDDLRGIGQIKPGAEYEKAIDAIAQTSRGAAKAFPGLAKNQVDDVVTALKQPEFDGDSAVDAMKVLRENADIAYRKGDTDMGRAYRAAAKAVEDELERALSKSGQPDKLARFREARTLIAKTHSVEDALNPATGNVVGQKLAGLLRKNTPLSGELKTAGRFAQAFPRASMEMLDSGSVRNTDLIVGGGTAALAREPWYLLYPFARDAVRAGVLSNAGQRMASPYGPQAPYGMFSGSLPALNAGLFTDERTR